MRPASEWDALHPLNTKHASIYVSITNSHSCVLVLVVAPLQHIPPPFIEHITSSIYITTHTYTNEFISVAAPTHYPRISPSLHSLFQQWDIVTLTLYDTYFNLIIAAAELDEDNI